MGLSRQLSGGVKLPARLYAPWSMPTNERIKLMTIARERDYS